jgi:hypothetical protein
MPCYYLYYSLRYIFKDKELLFRIKMKKFIIFIGVVFIAIAFLSYFYGLFSLETNSIVFVLGWGIMFVIAGLFKKDKIN